MDKYIVVQWPDIQTYMDKEGFKDNAHLINDEKGIELFGSSAYFINEEWADKVDSQDVLWREISAALADTSEEKHKKVDIKVYIDKYETNPEILIKDIVRICKRQNASEKYPILFNNGVELHIQGFEEEAQGLSEFEKPQVLSIYIDSDDVVWFTSDFSDSPVRLDEIIPNSIWDIFHRLIEDYGNEETIVEIWQHPSEGIITFKFKDDDTEYDLSDYPKFFERVADGLDPFNSMSEKELREWYDDMVADEVINKMKEEY